MDNQYTGALSGGHVWASAHRRTFRNRQRTERFGLCVTPGERRTLAVLIALDGNGGLAVRRAAVRSAAQDAYIVRVVGQMYRTAREEAPVVITVAHSPAFGPDSLLASLRGAVGPFADIGALQLSGVQRSGTWGTALRGASQGLGVDLEDTDAMTVLAKDCEMRATGKD